MAEGLSLEAAARAMREAMRETVRRHSLWYLVQGVLMVLAGLMALVYPLASSLAVVVILWSSMPVTATWLLGLLVGIMLISEGAALATLAWKLRQSGSRAQPAS
jgi:uncharacterized membrane protein HdeD (DUF308 family)